MLDQERIEIDIANGNFMKPLNYGKYAFNMVWYQTRSWKNVDELSFYVAVPIE